MESAQELPEPGAQRGWSYPGNRPFVVLTVIALIGAGQAFATALWPPNADTDRTLNIILGLASLAVAVATILAAGRVGIGYINIPLAAGIVIASVFALITHSGQGQMLCGFSMVMLGLFAAYFLQRRAAYAQLTLLVLTFASALLINPHLITPLYGIVMIAIIVIVVMVVASLVRHLREEAVHDPLTGALNRRGLAESAYVLHEIDNRGGRPTAVIEIDLDGFKEYNDVNGHTAGDALLETAVHDWRKALRGSDLLARTGGDEFVVVLPDTDDASVQRTIARMRACNDVRWSAGVSQWLPDESLSEAITRADADLYRIKARGHGS